MPSAEKNQKEELPQAVAVTVSDPIAVPTAATPHAARVVATQHHGDLSPAIVEDEHVGICRKCRRVFERPPGVNDGQAQYYRCPECNGTRWGDMIAGSCIVN